VSNKLRYSDFAHRIDIDALVNELGIDFIEDDGVEMRAFCPLPYNAHTNGDTTGKFSLNRDKRIYGCWVCGGGNLLSLAMSMKDLDPEPATKWLYQFASHEETDEEFEEHLAELLSDPEDRQPIIPYFNERVLEKWEPAFDNEWLRQERGISEQVIGQFSVRYNPAARRTLKEEAYEGPAIYFPHFWKDKLVGWQQRWLEPEDDRPRWVPKYTMTPDFPKNETLYGYDRARQWIREDLANEVIVVESVPSALFLWTYDLPSVATFGSSVDERQLKLLRTFPRVILAPDNDVPEKRGAKPAGEKWADGMQAYLEPYIEVLRLPPLVELGPKSDIGDLAPYGPEALQAYLDTAYDSLDAAL
jgi:DNA primase